jgi:hypothetical protein
MYIEDAKERIEQTHKIAPNSQVLYPLLPSDTELAAIKESDKQPITDLMEGTKRCLEEMDILEKNRENREVLEMQEQSKRKGKEEEN